ncbi:membrane alanyl aminopeptidase-like [Spodoptera litura]|uniref:Aminopeptidase n=1 Tax=Spodoptera litura TaxID=69820 RepID=A0A9J7ITA0_SPOLT|nr:membrane alanyl aminopeptidase-like [Spodoptera litura]
MGTKMLVPAVLCVLLGFAAATPLEDFRSNLEFHDYSSNVADPAYRLRPNVYPTDVKVNLENIDLEGARFTGSVEMIVIVRENDLEQISMHQNNLFVTRVNVVNNTNGENVQLRSPDPFTYDNYYELLHLHFHLPIVAGSYTITIDYRGVINTNPVDRGFYRGYYYYENTRRYYATTQFQPYHARKAFPCFDEPQFKSRYTISITRPDTLGPSYSNMAISSTEVIGNSVRETFYPTPIISAYLVAFHVSDFVPTVSTSTAPRPFSIISRRGATDQHAYAAEIGVEITNQLDDYLGIEYHDMGQGQIMKNDHIALPDFPSGAMENWGMVNYREAYLLYDPANTNLVNKIFIATIMAHELGHKWFGNLVTCFWWSNLWLNESFASYFEYFAAHWADPKLELADQFIVDYVHSALNADASPSATPMNWEEVADNPTITQHFSTTSYAKGASVLRMMEHFVGPRTFRNALRHYLRDNAYGIGNPSLMYQAFNKAIAEDHTFLSDFPNINFGNVFDSWVQNRGSPVVEVTRNPETGVIVIEQKRYQLSGEPPTQTWEIPLSWTEQKHLDFSSTKPRQLLNVTSTALLSEPGDNFVIFNIQQSGLYRVKYDEDNWRALSSYLNSNNRERIHKLNRAQIVNDVLHFIRSGDIDRTLGFEVIDFLRSETDYYVWNGALTQLDWIRRRLEHMPRAHEAFTSYLRGLMNNVINHLGYNEGPNDSTSTILNRIQILNYACNIGHSGCVSDSLQKWNDYKENNEPVPVNLRRHVYCTGLREGDRSDYDFLFNAYNSSENAADMVIMLRALACTKDLDALGHYLQESMYNDKIRIHDRTNAFSFALQGNLENVQFVSLFLQNNYDTIRTT